jgi:3-polyprenyl-4-hydroxybenzoate decarboxylase
MVLWNDLRGWLAAVEEIGELVKIEAPTDWNEEISGITYLVGKKKGGPALLFDNIKPSPWAYL